MVEEVPWKVRTSGKYRQALARMRYLLSAEEKVVLESLELPVSPEDEEWYERAEAALKPLKRGWHGPAVRRWLEKRLASYPDEAR